MRFYNNPPITRRDRTGAAAGALHPTHPLPVC